MRGGHSAVGVRHALVCVTEDTDPSPVDRISWWKVVRTPSRPFGQNDEFTVTASSGIRNRDVRVVEIVVRELEKAKPDKWGYVQSRELWSQVGGSWTLLAAEVRQGSWKQQLRREEFQVGYPQVRGVQGCAFWER